MRRTRLVLVLLVGSLLTALVSGGNMFAQSSTTCDDFTYQQEAQKAWDEGDG